MYNNFYCHERGEMMIEKDDMIEIVNERLSVYLMVLKITPNLKGYQILKDCALRVYEDSAKKHRIHENLYLDLAERYNQNATLIQRALRHAIEVSSKRNGIKDFERLMDIEFFDDKPSPRELICVLVERAVVECNRLISNRSSLYKRFNDTLLK